ncbi:hypothetical protein IV102_23520 [bacterium]|nr:hypothetical protein [bacterium]
MVWRPASDGLVTVEALIQAVRNQPDTVNDSATVLLELERLRQGLRAAQDQDTPFSWLIEHGSVTSALVWERRGGHP